MSKSDAFETQLLSLIFNSTPLPWSTPTLYIALHTTDPTESGNQSTGEVAYTGYSRYAIDRDLSSWLISSGVASNVNEIIFPECLGNPASVWYVSIGLSATGSSQILYCGELDSAMSIDISTSPSFHAGDLLIQEE